MQILYQAERSECGLVSLAMVASHHGLNYELASLRGRFPVSTKGLTLKAVIKIAGDLSLDSRAVRCEVEDLANIRLPAILHWRMDHFVVLIKKRGKRYIVNDPGIGQITVSEREMNESFTGVALELWPGKEFKKADLGNSLKLSAVIPRTKGLLSALVMIVLTALAIEAMVLVMPILQQLIIDDALVTSDSDLLMLLTIATGVFLIGQSATAAVRGIIQRNLTSTLSLVIPSSVFKHLASLPTSWFERRAAADVVNRMDSANSIHRTLTSSTINAGIDGLVAMIALAAMFTYSPYLTLIVVAAFIFYIFVRLLSFGVLKQKNAGALVQQSRVQGLLWETLRGISTVKLFNGEGPRKNQFLATLSQSVRLQVGIGTINTAFAFAHDMIFAAERLAIIYLGATSVFQGKFSVGMLLAFFSFRENFVQKASSLVDTAIEFKMLNIHLDRLADILLTDSEDKNQLPFAGDQNVEGRLEVRNVSYRYGENEADVLRNVSLSVKQGEIVAITGPSGAGKSTLFKVMTGQIKVAHGDVLLDGNSVSSIGLERWRDLIAVVRQDDMLFSGTITENIAFLQELPDHERIKEAAKKARIDEEISRMPMGYNTLIGSMGTGLSGGQAQRIMLARALYRQPKVLLLDEATSQLDVENEKNISLTLRGLGITQIVIAHRPETIAKADRVVDIRNLNNQGESSVVPFPKKSEELVQ